MTQFVLDASVALSWIFEDEHSPYADRIAVIVNEKQAFVPVIWPLEIANAVLTAIRRERLLAANAALFLDEFAELRIEIDRGLELESFARAMVTVGLTHRLSAYDASYLELAMRRGLPLATQDERLARAAAAAGVEILDPLRDR